MRTNHARKIRELREEDAVSPVIATILMVAITVVLAGTLYVWAANLAESNTDGSLELYTFSSNDAAGSPSMATDDNLAITTMTQGESIGWASLSIAVSVDGAAAVQCALPGQTNGGCIVVESETNDGGVWAMGEDITIQENGVDLCNAAACDLTITITNARAGKSLGVTTTVTEQGGGLVALPRMDTQTIGADGGAISIQGATISIPAGALAADTELTFEALTAADVNDQDVANYDIPTTFLKLTPHGTTFSQPVTVTIAATSGMPDNPTIYTKADDNSLWEEFTDQITVSGNTISFNIYGFSYYFGADATSDDVPRISYWWGKVNQHVENGQWMTDPDGTSGANLDMLQYCQKWYPDTIAVVELPERESIVFYNAGNNGNFPTIKPVFECVQPDDGTGGGGSGGGDPNACIDDTECMAGGYCLNGACVYNDQDMDGIPDDQDNCPANANADQVDADADGVGDACDNDQDNDGISNAQDNCPRTPNIDQANTDGDVYGDACDAYPNISFDPDTICTAEFNPVCGIDGNTYGNPCEALKANVQVDYNGVCGSCVPDCTGCECGDDGCGGSCGTCPNGESCNYNQVCVECDEDTDCPSGTPLCNPPTGECVECTSNAWCATGYCVDYECVECIQASDCASGICDANGDCAPAGYGVVTWGGLDSGHSGDVTSQISSGVVEIYSTSDAFAAIKTDGSVVTWGHPYKGGDSSSVASELTSSVIEISSTGTAFAALKSDGSVVTWGGSTSFSNGGDSSSVSSQISSGVTEIFSTNFAFAALKSDGSVVTWGGSGYGGDSSSVSSQLSSGVTEIFSTVSAFAALKSDGSVVTWGESTWGGDSSSVSSQISSGVTEIFSSASAFAAQKSDGSVVTWGHSMGGGDSSSVSSQISSGVTEIFSSDGAFAALKSDGSVVTWGLSSGGGDSSSVSSQISSGVTEIFSSEYAFAALKSDGSVVTWGDSSEGGDSSSVSSQISSGVTEIFSTDTAFAALKSDGSVVTWGDSSNGGDSSSIASSLSSGVSEIFSSDRAFAALKSDGSVVTWGHSDYGGDSSSVTSSLSSGVQNVYSSSKAFAVIDNDG